MTSIIIRAARLEDLPTLQTILETWIYQGKTPELTRTAEIQGILQAVKTNIDTPREIHYLVAEESNIIIGMMGFRTLTEERMKSFATTENPAELINAYVRADYRGGKGVGTALLSKLEQEARMHGFTEVAVNSGPRFKETGWGFYTKMYGEPIGLLTDYYGPGRDAPVWSKIL